MLAGLLCWVAALDQRLSCLAIYHAAPVIAFHCPERHNRLFQTGCPAICRTRRTASASNFMQGFLGMDGCASNACHVHRHCQIVCMDIAILRTLQPSDPSQGGAC